MLAWSEFAHPGIKISGPQGAGWKHPCPVRVAVLMRLTDYPMVKGSSVRVPPSMKMVSV